MTWNSLYKKDSKGRIRFWSVTLGGNNEIALQRTSTGICGNNEVVKTAEKEHKRNKSSNAMDSAQKKIQTQYNNKIKTGYFITIEEAETTDPPKMAMLASEMKEAEIMGLPDDFFPCYAQIKLNGIRGTYDDNKGKILSRELNPFNKLSDLAGELQELLLPTSHKFLDMELYAPGYAISDIVSMVRHGDERICAYIFDVPSNLIQDYRLNDLLSLRLRSPNFSERIKFVNTYTIDSRERLLHFYHTVIDAGEEGMIIRKHNGIYKWNNKTTRGDELIKVKPPESAEFEIVEVLYDELIIEKVKRKLIKFVCKTDKGLTFKWSPTSWGHEKRISEYQEYTRGAFSEKTLPPASLEFREYTKRGLPFHIMDGYLREVM